MVEIAAPTFYPFVDEYFIEQDYCLFFRRIVSNLISGSEAREIKKNRLVRGDA